MPKENTQFPKQKTVGGGTKGKHWVQVTEEQVKEALEKNNGLVYPAAKYLGIDVYALENRMRKPEMREFQKQCSEAAKDHATSKLFENIDKNHEGAIEFYLRTQARDRGFGETSLINVNQNNISAQQEINVTLYTEEEQKLLYDFINRQFETK